MKKMKAILVVISLILTIFVFYPSVSAESKTFYSSASDGFISRSLAPSYSYARDATSGNTLFDTSNNITIGQSLVHGQTLDLYYIYRGFVYFDTSQIPSNAVINSAVLYVYCLAKNVDINGFSVVVQNGQPTYPHDPMVVEDYNRNHYSDNGAYVGLGSFYINAYNSMVLNSNGIGFIQKGLGAKTKLCLRSSNDINNEPIKSSTYGAFFDRITFSACEEGHAPYLIIDYTTPSSDNPPDAQFTWWDADGDGFGTTINFDASGSTDDHGIVSYEWDWTNDGIYEYTNNVDAYCSYDYGDTNIHDCNLRVTDTIGQTATVVHEVQATNNPPNEPSNPFPPVSDIDNVPVSVTLSWDGGDPDGDAVTYDLYISMCQQPDFFSPYNTEDITTEEYPILLGVGSLYYWRVLATDEYGAQNLGPIWEFSTITVDQLDPSHNKPPNKPATPTISNLRFPNNLYVGDMNVYTTSVVDPDGDNVNLYWDFDGDDSVDFELLNVKSGEANSIIYIWDKSTGAYNVRVIATDILSSTSEWSDPKPVNVGKTEGNRPPSTPSTPSGNSMGYVNQPITFTTVSYDPDAWRRDKISYRWDWDDGSYSEWLGSYESGETVTATYSWNKPGNYDVNVSAVDLNGAGTDWSGCKTVSIVYKNTATIFNHNDFCGFTYGDIFDNFPGEGRLIYANGKTGAIATGAYAGFPYGASWSTACQGVQFYVGKTKELKIDAEISYVSGTPSLAYSCLRKIIKVDGPYQPEQEFTEWINNIGSVEDLQAFCTAAIGLLKNGVYQPSAGLKLYDLIETTNWVTNHIKDYPYHVEVADQIVNEFNAVSRMGNQGKIFYQLAWKEIQRDGGFVPEGVSLEASTNTFVKSTTAGQPTAVLGRLALVLQVALELWTLYELMTHWQVDTLLEKFENSGQAETIHVTHTFTFDKGNHTVWAGLQSEAYGALIFFGFAFAAGLVKSITIYGISSPDIPILTIPSELKAKTPIQFKAVGTDQNGDQIQYIINWGDGTTTTADPCASGTNVQVDHTYSGSGVYTIKIRSKDCDKMESENATYTIRIAPRGDINTQQSQSILISERNQQSNLPISQNSQQSNQLIQKLLTSSR